jgi:hypothetical protein
MRNPLPKKWVLSVFLVLGTDDPAQSRLLSG